MGCVVRFGARRGNSEVPRPSTGPSHSCLNATIGSIPFLYVFGEYDVNVPTEASIRVLEEVRAATGQEISSHVYPGDDHTLNRMSRILTATYPAGYFDRMVDFALDALAATD